MSLIVQISDPHFGTERAEVVAALVKLVHAQSPDLIIVSGDITQRARRAQFRSARTFVDSLSVPARLVIPGNHDIPLFNLFARLFTPYANFRREFGAELEPIFDSKEVLAITVNTTRPYRHKNGEVSEDQLERVAQRLRHARTTQLRIVVTHQPVHVPRKEEEKNLLHGHIEAIRRWSAAGADLILGGHIHLPYVSAQHQLFPDLARRLWVVQAGTAVSSRIRHEAGNSVNLIRYRGSGLRRSCSVERWDFRDQDQCFTPAAIDELELEKEENPRHG